ncbi:GNAT family N-acetyltransferase [bacterium CPR1]|nr:GNAT family N-acetyltransferase [bacterium CPR1]
MGSVQVPYCRQLDNGLVVSSTRPEHARQLEQLQSLVFPTLDDLQRMKAPHYLKHLELFPEGQFVLLDGEKVVGMTTTLRLNFDFDHVTHDFEDVMQGGWMTSHDPQGEWLYGADIGTHPEYRRMGIARALYQARHDTVRRLGLKGQVTVGMLSGYGGRKQEMRAEDYYAEVCAGRIQDPTVSMQMRVGFEPRGLLADYLRDPVCDNYGAVLVLSAERGLA